jgi:transcriptional regulator GlxA family with amidase domain
MHHLERVHPGVHWVRGVRYHDDEGIISSTTVAAGIDASPHTVDRLVGRRTAKEVARRLGYGATRYLDDPRSAPPSTASGRTHGRIGRIFLFWMVE